MLEAGSPAGLAPGGVPQNFAGLMLANEGGTSGYLSPHAGLGLQPMVRRTLGGVLPASARVAHPLLFNSASLPASALFQSERAHQLVPLPDTDISLFGSSTGMSQIANTTHHDAIGGAFTSLDSSAPEDFYSERKLEGFDGRLENIRKRHRTNNF
jgi:hypothetical protein